MTPVDGADFRRVAGQFASGIMVVTTHADGVDHAMTVTAFASVSLEPQRVLFCAEKIARFHDAVLDAGFWAVSVLDEDGEKVARWLATRGRPLDGQLAGGRAPSGPGRPGRRCWTTRSASSSAGPRRCTTAATTASWSARSSGSASRGPAAGR